jgi:hypothetical protein
MHRAPLTPSIFALALAGTIYHVKRLPFSIEAPSEAECDKRARLINPLACWRAWFSIFTAL